MSDNLHLMGYPSDPRLWKWNCGLQGGSKVIKQLLEAVDHPTEDLGVVDGPCSNGEPPCG
jgi:hypothetical protein